MNTFADLLAERVREARIPSRPLPPGECQSPSGKRCMLCHAPVLEYHDEVRLKNVALQQFWGENVGTSPLQPLVRSPDPRNYRVVTKRKVHTGRDGSTILGLIDPDERMQGGVFTVATCAIEPEAHNKVYAVAGECLGKPYATPLVRVLRYIILKGKNPAVILSVEEISPAVIKAANTLSKTLTRTCDTVSGVFLYEDDSDGRYYMGDATRGKLHRIHGRPDVLQHIGKSGFLHSPLSFSQVNPAVAGLMVGQMKTLLTGLSTGTLFDLYCGYGLFALSLAGLARRVVAAEVSPHSIASAIANAKRMGIRNVRFVRNDITSDTLSMLLRGCSRTDVVVLDPPRSGTSGEVIEHIGATGPGMVIHLFCNLEILPHEVQRWRSSGYDVVEATPFDMFPCAPSIEVMGVLRKV